MHEHAICSEIINTAAKQGDVKEITVLVGELAHLPAAELKEALSQLVAWKITVKETPAKVLCQCGYSGRPRVIEHGHDYALFECPRCKEIPKIVVGEDIVLSEVIV